MYTIYVFIIIVNVIKWKQTRETTLTLPFIVTVRKSHIRINTDKSGT